MVQRFRIICKSCNIVHGTTENPTTSGIPAKCSNCGMERIAMEAIAEEVITTKEFDLFINNKRDGTSVHHGFQLTVDMIKDKTEEQIKEIFIEEAAKTLGNLLTLPELSKILTKRGGN